MCTQVTVTVLCAWHGDDKSLFLSHSVSVSEFIPRGPGCGRRRVSRDAVLRHRADSALLGRLACVLPVPVCGHVLVVPDGGGLGVAEVAGLSCVVGGVDEQRLHREGLQVPRLEVSHVVSAAEGERKRIMGDYFICWKPFVCLLKELQRKFSQEDPEFTFSVGVCFFSLPSQAPFFHHCVRLSLCGGPSLDDQLSCQLPWSNL